MRLYSCCWSPTSTLLEYIEFIGRLESSIRGSKDPVVVAGDFNAWHTSWKSKKNNHRGDVLYDMIVGLSLLVCNQANKPTFECRGRQSIVLAAKITR